MTPISGKPLLEWQVERLIDNGVAEICIVVGHLGDKIREHFGDGSKTGARICYYREAEPLGTAGALTHLGGFIGDGDFLLVFGDTVFDIDIGRMAKFHESRRSKATMFVHPNSHPFDSDLVSLGADWRVTALDFKGGIRSGWHQNIVNAGLCILSSSAIPESGGWLDLERDLLSAQIKLGHAYGYRSAEYIKDAGTAERVAQIERDMASGIVSRRNLANKQKAIFLDRDGTLNRDMGADLSLGGFELFPEAAEAVRLINASDYLAIVATNQPMAAKGFITLGALYEIHAKMETLLGLDGAYLDAIYCCPHHPEHGFAGEVPELKIECACRKPKPGMLLQAAEDCNLDLRESYMIGDSESDAQAAASAGATPVLLKNGLAVLEAVKGILEGRH
jgi:histidinol-phosphate phosphatase family protein